MLPLLDAVALSFWAEGRTREVAAWLHHSLDSAGAVDGPAGGDDLVNALAWIGEGDCPAALAASLRAEAARMVAAATSSGLTLVAWGDPGYPPLLAAIPDPPAVLWVRGSLEALRRPAVALVGSRAGSVYGLEVATRLAADLAAMGLTVVSGLARGIDSAAHRGALEVCGTTVAVLGSGLHRLYPPEHAELASRVAESGGAVVSELPPDALPLPRNFPARNRIISGLSLGVVVIEAAERSGSLITATCALEQGREVMAVPGNVLSGRYRGGHALIRDGAAVVESAADVLAVLRSNGLQTGEAVADALDPDQEDTDPVLRAMNPGDAYDLDGLSHETAWPVTLLLPRLLELELLGLVRRVGGGRFVRAVRTC